VNTKPPPLLAARANFLVLVAPT